MVKCTKIFFNCMFIEGRQTSLILIVIMFSRRRCHNCMFFKVILFIFICIFNVTLWIHFTTKINSIQGILELQMKQNNFNQNSNVLKESKPKLLMSSSVINKIINERRRAEEENTDEFLVDVLKKCKYIEINLKTNSFDKYDEEISEDIKKIIQGLGENGTKGFVPKSKEEMATESIKREGFNNYLSDMITLNRSVPDYRDEACKNMKYDMELPDASIVITFNNEALSTFLRTIYSVINKSPTHLIKEIILVDDYSEKKELKGKLVRYLMTKFLPDKIRLVKLLKRVGLIQARMIGAHLATGDVIVFLDSHCETGHSWLEPLLQRIKDERTAVVSPVVDTIDSKTFEYTYFEFQRIGFNWNGHFTWINIPEYEKKRKASHHSPTRSPMMIGGLFAINRKYFWEIGSYDSEMQLWGGENFEMSFRVWQCGGSIEIIPCSRVGHIFRGIHPYIPSISESHGLNTARLAEVWMDDYKENIYRYNEHLKVIKTANIGDVSKRIELKKRLKCKNFEWYLDNIYKEKFRLAKGSSYFGQVKNEDTSQCLDNMLNYDYNSNYSLLTYPCHSAPNISKFQQTFYLSNSTELRREYLCATSRSKANQSWIEMSLCEKLSTEEKKWEYKESVLKHVATKTCLTVLPLDGKFNLVLDKCDTKLSSQQWTFVIV